MATLRFQTGVRHQTSQQEKVRRGKVQSPDATSAHAITTAALVLATMLGHSLQTFHTLHKLHSL